MTRRALCLIVVFLAAFFSAAPVSAQNISETQRLNFGEWLVTNNNASHTITLNANGTYSNSPSLVMLTPPQVGEYFVDGLPSHAVVNGVTVTMTDPLNGPGSQSFTMDNFDTICPNADVNGITTITLGARAVMSGNSVGYGDGLYTGELTLEIDF